jgi:hypothetical protein
MSSLSFDPKIQPFSKEEASDGYSLHPAQSFHPLFWRKMARAGRVKGFLSVFLLTGAAGLLWGILRIELILFVPYFYLIWYLFDAGVYLLLGTKIGQYLYGIHAYFLVVSLPFIAVFYIADRFVSHRLILNASFSVSVLPAWRLAFEASVLLLAFVAAAAKGFRRIKNR